MKKYVSIAFIFVIIFTLFSCERESETYLINKIESIDFNFEDFSLESENIVSNFDNGIQYGRIHFENGESVKFWFVSHHMVDDYGGAIYEFQDGETQFCYSYHCCEVQFPNSENSDFSFSSLEDFKRFIRKIDGTRP